MSIPGLAGMGLGAMIAGGSGSGSGGGSGSVSITDQAVNAMGTGTQVASYVLTGAGLVQRGKNGVYNTLETWKLSGASSDYEARVTETGGSGITGGSAIGSWLALSSTREWELEETVSSAATQTEFTVEIRQAAAPNTVLDSAAIELNAVVF